MKIIILVNLCQVALLLILLRYSFVVVCKRVLFLIIYLLDMRIIHIFAKELNNETLLTLILLLL